jgi:glycosidase
VYYRLLNGWTSANIHYQIGSGPWTAVPGVPMNEAACTGWAKRTIALGTATGLKAAFNTNGTTWDNNSNQDYVLGTGLSTVNNRTVTRNAGNPCDSGTQPPPAFHWGNATVYFVMTDRFVNGNTANDSSHNRPRVDATGVNIGTFHGGDLAGLTTKVNDNYFTDLGVNALWITAPYEQIHGWIGGGERGDFAHWGYHGYYTLDWTNLDANLGTPNELKSFVDAAHAKGIRVVFDVVMNHAGYDTLQDMVEFSFGGKRPSFTEAAVLNWRPGEGQTWHSYHDIFIDYASTAAQPGWANWWGQPWLRAGIVGYEACGGGDLLMCLAGLPDLKTENPTAVALPPFLRNKPTFGKGYLTPYAANGSKPVREWVSEWLCKYVRDYGIDGFRVDTAKHVETPAWGFMKDRCSEALAQWRATNPAAPGANWTDDFWTTGEVFGRGAAGFDANYYVTGKFDSLINFGFRGVAAGAAGTPGALTNLDATYSSYASQLNADRMYSFSLLSFLDNHDIAPLFFNGDVERQKRAGTALLMTPGAVQVFYGDEYGRSFGATASDPTQGTRSDMNWGAVTSQLANPASALLHWRKIGQFRRKHVAIGIGDHQRISDVSNGYAFTRIWNADKLVVVVGASGSSTVNVTSVFADGTQVRNYYDDTTRTVSGGRVTFEAGTNGVILLEIAN